VNGGSSRDSHPVALNLEITRLRAWFVRPSMKRIAIHFVRFGPYHLARIEAAAKVLAAADWEVVGLETSGSDATYAWEVERGETAWERRTVFPGEVLEEIPVERMRTGMA